MVDADVPDGFEDLLPTKRFFGLEAFGLPVDSTWEGTISYNGLWKVDGDLRQVVMPN